MSERLVVDSIMTADGEVVPLGPVDKDGWENARGCRIEHDAAVAYGLEVLYED